MAEAEMLLREKLVLSADALCRVRELVCNCCGRYLAKEEAAGLVMAVNEACANIFRHAYGEKPGDIILEIFHNQQEVTVRITDFAEPVDPGVLEKGRDLEAVRPGGLGNYFMKTLTDRVELRRPESGRGNVLELTKKIRKQS